MTWPSHHRPSHSSAIHYSPPPHCYYYCKLGFEDRPCLMQLGSSTSTIGPRANIQPRWWSSQLHRLRALACLQVQFWREVRSSRSLSRGGEMYSNICLWIMPATIAMIMGVSSNLLAAAAVVVYYSWEYLVLSQSISPKLDMYVHRYAECWCYILMIEWNFSATHKQQQGHSPLSSSSSDAAAVVDDRFTKTY